MWAREGGPGQRISPPRPPHLQALLASPLHQLSPVLQLLHHSAGRTRLASRCRLAARHSCRHDFRCVCGRYVHEFGEALSAHRSNSTSKQGPCSWRQGGRLKAAYLPPYATLPPCHRGMAGRTCRGACAPPLAPRLGLGLLWLGGGVEHVWQLACGGEGAGAGELGNSRGTAQEGCSCPRLTQAGGQWGGHIRAHLALRPRDAAHACLQGMPT